MIDKKRLTKFKEFDHHRLVAFLNDSKNKLKAFVAIHRGGLNKPSFGATRLWHYKTDKEALEDVLKLSKTMSYKLALAGFKYGGAKGVIIPPSTYYNKTVLLQSYAKMLKYFGGKFITGTDVGLSQRDLKIMKNESNFFIGLKVKPEQYTALGLFEALKVCLKLIFKNDQPDLRSFAIQGVGKIGKEFLKLIYRINSKNQKIFVSDVNVAALKSIKKQFPKVIITSPKEIYKKEVDVFCPCALSNSLTYETISYLKTKIIIGGANNQLQNDEIGKILFKKGILYAPDFVVNAGGLISVIDEYQHSRVSHKRITKKISKIKNRLLKIIQQSKLKSKATNIIANQMAEKIINNNI